MAANSTARAPADRSKSQHLFPLRLVTADSCPDPAIPDPSIPVSDCPLCAADGGRLVLRRERWRVVIADETGYPAFTRVIWGAHVAEMTDLDASARRELFDAVLAVEAVQRRVLAPDKTNLASLGNQVPHLHWHVIPRWRDDPHFPAPVWAASSPSRAAAAAARSDAVRTRLDSYVDALREALGR